MSPEGLPTPTQLAPRPGRILTHSDWSGHVIRRRCVRFGRQHMRPAACQHAPEEFPRVPTGLPICFGKQHMRPATCQHALEGFLRVPTGLACDLEDSMCVLEDSLCPRRNCLRPRSPPARPGSLFMRPGNLPMPPGRTTRTPRKNSRTSRLVWRVIRKTACAPGILPARPGRIPARPVWSTHMLRKTAHAPRKKAPLPGGPAYAHTACPARPGSLFMRPGILSARPGRIPARPGRPGRARSPRFFADRGVHPFIYIQFFLFQRAISAFFKKTKIFFKNPFTNPRTCGIIYLVRGALAQLVAHNTGSVGVRSSSLLCSTIQHQIRTGVCLHSWRVRMRLPTG